MSDLIHAQLCVNVHNILCVCVCANMHTMELSKNTHTQSRFIKIMRTERNELLWRRDSVFHCIGLSVNHTKELQIT